jgi:hypothetical protein
VEDDAADSLFSNSIFSKFIIKQMMQQKTGPATEKNLYMESNLIELMNKATGSLEVYENATNTRMNFFFHDDALRHLARLTRILAINRGHALLISHQSGLGRTNIVRFAAYLSKMKVNKANF